MKSTLIALAALLLSTSITLSDSSSISVLKLPTLSADELKQVTFAATIDSSRHPGKPLAAELHNPFRDKRLVGVVIHVQPKSADDKKQDLDLFADVDCAPLQSVQLQVPVFNAEELIKSGSVITLKQVLRGEFSPDTKVPDFILQSPTLSAEELKRVPFAARLQPVEHQPLHIDLHNPFRDQGIRGVVVLIRFKPTGGKEQSIELLVDLTCGPLESRESDSWFANAAEIAKFSPVITLKEVHRER
jgi:hypothetical protein